MTRRASTAKRTATTTTTTLAPSAAHIRLDGLESEHERLLKQIKKKRNEVTNFVEQMRSYATEIYHKTTPKVQKITALNQEIHILFKEILTNKKLGKQTKKKITEIYRSLQSAGIISYDSDDEDIIEDDFDDDEEQRPPHEYHQHQSQTEFASPSATKSDESKKIRSYFLRLAEIFHPDKASDSETQAKHTEIMKEINKAYQEGDLARLLEIEELHQVGESIDSNSDSDLTRKCDRLEKQIQFLKKQYEGLKRELREYKKSPGGSIVADCRKAKKHGVDPINEISEQIDHQVQIISEIRDYVKDFESSKMSVQEFLQGPEVLRSLKQEMMEDLLEQMFQNMENF
jgi:hypothetical protein